LADVHGLPDPAAGVHGEYRRVVIGVATGVELGDHDVQNLSRKQQPGRHAQRRAIDHGSPTLTALVVGHVTAQPLSR
jgi:hypothetical protein